MKKKTTILFIFITILFGQLYAQPGFDLVSNGGGNYQLSMYYGAVSSVNGVPYEQIKGSPFMTDKWQHASLYNIKNELISERPVLLNLVTGEIYFMEGEKPMVADKEIVRKVVVHSSASAKDAKAVYLNFVPNLRINDMKVNDFAEVFHSGYAKLIKYRRKELAQSEGGGGMPKYYFFKDFTYYFVQVKNQCGRLNRLSRDVLFEQLPGAYGMQDWVDDNKLNLKKEADVIKFIEYYNSVKEKEGK